MDKLKSNSFDFPLSTPDKLVFVSNKYGNGFKRTSLPSALEEFPVEEMKGEVDGRCYSTWKEHKNQLESHSFGQEEVAIKVLCFAAIFFLSVYIIAVLCEVTNDNLYYSFSVLSVLLGKKALT